MYKNDSAVTIKSINIISNQKLLQALGINEARYDVTQRKHISRVDPIRNFHPGYQRF